MAQTGLIVPTSASSTFPGCALSCTVLLEAQTLCYPPSQPTTNQLTYDRCFCQSNFLNALYSTPDSICIAECTLETDRTLLQSWYKNFCAQVQNGVDPVGGAQTTTTVTSTAGHTTTANTIAATLTSPPTHNPNSSANSQTWIDTHWRWIIMIGVLAIGLAAIAFLAAWLKKRHRRKIEAKRAAASGFSYDPEKRPPGPRRSATPELWGPHQMMQATQGYQYTAEGVMPESSKRHSKRRHSERSKPDEDAIEVAEVGSGTFSSLRSSQRTRPSQLEANARKVGADDRSSRKGRKKSNERMTDKDIEASLQGKRKSKHKKERADSEKS